MLDRCRLFTRFNALGGLKMRLIIPAIVLLGFIALAYYSYQWEYDPATYGIDTVKAYQTAYSPKHKKVAEDWQEKRKALKELYGDND
jgi:hypothetical protein